MNAAAAGYLADLTASIGELVDRQPEAVARAAEVFAGAIEGKGAVHVYDTGHMIAHELVARTGGLVAFTRLEFSGQVGDGPLGMESRRVSSDPEVAAARLIEWLFAQRTIQQPDVLLLSSVSGVSVSVVELAIQARARGIGVVALTSVEFSSRLPARHSSGHRLLDVADVVLDNLAPYGDATQALSGLEARLCPLSGVAGAALLWAIVAETTRLLLARGVAPSVYPSINLPDGPARVDVVEAHYRETGQ